jgi:hypothetical protein
MPTTEHAIEVDAVLKQMLKGPKTQKQLGCTRHRLLMLLEAKLIKRAGEAKNRGSAARRAVTYDLTAKGRKRAAKL